MDNFAFNQDDCKEETTSTWLIAVMQFGLKTKKTIFSWKVIYFGHMFIIHI